MPLSQENVDTSILPTNAAQEFGNQSVIIDQLRVLILETRALRLALCTMGNLNPNDFDVMQNTADEPNRGY